MTDDTIKLLQRMADGEVRLTVGAVGAALGEIKRLRDAALYPPWLADAAEALGEVRPEDGAPLALNWTQVIAAIHELREDRDHWKLRAERAEYALPSTPGALVIDTPYQCRVCGGTGRNPMSDNANWLPCAACMARQRGMIVGP